MATIQTKILIIGAGPGGAAAALQLAKLGIPSIVVDKAIFPRDKVCGDGLSAKVVSLMNRLDAEMATAFDAIPKKRLPSWGIRFVAPNGYDLMLPFKKNYDTTKDTPAGYVSKRIDFDNFLVEQMQHRTEITVMQGVELTDFERTSSGFTVKDKQKKYSFETNLLLVANGANSTFTRKIAGIEREKNHYCAGVRAYFKGVKGTNQDGFIELHFFKRLLPGYFWIFPLPNGEANVGVVMDSATISKKKINLNAAMLQCIAEEPTLKDRFSEAMQVTKTEGYGLPIGSKRRNLSGDNFILVGDAAYLVDPFSGEGIGNAMYSGVYAANQAKRCLETNDFSATFIAQYNIDIYRVLGQELSLSRKLQQLLRFPFLFNIFAKLANRNPKIAELMSSMFLDMDLREKLLSPKFLFKLIFRKA